MIRLSSCCGWILTASIGCGGAGQLDPFASGAGDGSDSASGTTALTATGTDTGTGSGIPAGVVFVRCPRTVVEHTVSGTIEVGGASVEASRTFHHVDVYDRLPSAVLLEGSVAPCDLVFRHDDGEQEVLFDCASQSSAEATCVALDPAVSPDGERVAFVVVYGSLTTRTESVDERVIDANATGGSIRSAVLPNPNLVPMRSELHALELATGERTITAGTPGEFRRSPGFLPDGRLLFSANVVGTLGTAVREPAEPWAANAEPVTTVFVMQADGSDLQRIGAHDLTAARSPLVLADGRVAVVSTQRGGLLPFRYNNGAVGSPGAYRNVNHIYIEDPDGARFAALFGQHTHLLGGEFAHGGALGLGQLGDGRLIFIEGGGAAGGGSLRAFAPDVHGLEGPPPHTVAPGDVFRPIDLVELAPWSQSSQGFSAAMPEPALEVPGYDDALAFAGFLRDPVGEPAQGLLLGWVKGACGDVAEAHESLFGSPPPPATSGNAGLIPLNALEWLGLDNPGCDAGIYRATANTFDHPQALIAIVDTPEFHELMPRRVGSYSDVHGQPAPSVIDPAHRRAAAHAELPFATPFALLGGSSVLQQETRSLDGNPFASETHWALQGAHAFEWVDDDVCGVRILAAMPNVPDDLVNLRSAFGHRLRIVAELPVVKADGGGIVLDPLGDPDTSFRLRVPADTPLLVASIDCDGNNLTASQVPFSVRPGEDRTCGGCHVRSTLPLLFDQTAAATMAPTLAGGGLVQLLAGGTPEAAQVESVDGFGAAYEFERDIWPILQSRCVSCHAGDAAPAGLRLDLAGIEPGSSYWRLGADQSQAYVPVATQGTVVGPLRPPQLSRYVRFFSARGSLLLWKAQGARLDGRTDADETDDVDFGSEHLTAATPAELRTIGRWIDTGAAGGASALADTAPPVVVARIAASAPATLLLGTVDLGSGIDPDSVSVQWSPDGLTWTALDAVTAALAGVTEVTLTGVPNEAVLQIDVADAAGNVTSIVRRRGSLVEPS